MSKINNLGGQVIRTEIAQKVLCWVNGVVPHKAGWAVFPNVRPVLAEESTLIMLWKNNLPCGPGDAPFRRGWAASESRNPREAERAVKLVKPSWSRRV